MTPPEVAEAGAKADAPELEILSGNEAIARGCWEAGVRFASAYPGTPSTEIMEALAKYDDVYAEWAPNEKVAVEAATGAALAGARALSTMKHVGLNVAADPFFSSSMIHMTGGLVIVSADDPAMHSSQDEQDNRNYAKFAKMPMIEPADADEALRFVKTAYEVSERFGTAVLYRTTTRTSHAQGVARLGERVAPAGPLLQLQRDPTEQLMMPHNAIPRHAAVEQRLLELAEYAETTELNSVEMGDTRVGIIASGAAYCSAKEAFPQASFLKIGMSWPLPRRLIADFRAKVDKLYVVEELDPFLEENIRLQGVQVDGGKDILPLCGEFNPGLVARLLSDAGVPGVDEGLLVEVPDAVADLPDRPPTLCPGCSHRGVFVALRRLRAFVSGDIGCYSLAALPPFEAMHCSTCMGAGISMAHGMSKVMDASADQKNRPVAIIGDSTFFHTGINSLLDIAYNQSNVVTVILDNRTTAMTGGQENPSMGKTLQGKEAPLVDIPALVRSLGITRVREIDPFDVAQCQAVLKEEIAADEPSVVIATYPCVLQYRINGEAYTVDPDALHRLQGLPARRLHRPQPVQERGRRAAGRDRPRLVHRLRRVRAALPVRGDRRPRDRRRKGRLMTPRPTFNILISGVGGQGVVLASYVLSRVALAEGYDVKQSEVHGMAQRGGCVTSHLRFGDQVHSSLITPGTVDVLLSFESVEAMRYVHWLKPGGLLVYNAARVTPSTVSSGAEEYPEGIEERIAEVWPNVRAVDASALAGQAGTVKAANVVMLGAMASALPFTPEMLESVIRKSVPPKTVDVNLAAFKLGLEVAVPA